MANNDLKVNLIGDASKLTASLNTASSKLAAFGKKAKDVGKNLSLKLTLPIALAGGAAIKLASDFQESLNKVDVSFGKSSTKVRDFAKTTLTQFGIAEGSALDMAALFGDMGTSMGLTTDDAANMSTTMVGLAGDLASFKNIGIDQATTALAGVFTGETESLKRLGIVMTEVNLKQFAMEQGIQKNIKSMTQAEKVNLRYEYILSKTGNSQGDFANTSENAANQMRMFGEGLKQLGAEFGSILLPAFTKIVNFGNKLINKFINLDDSTKKIIVVVGLLAAAIGPVIFAIGAIASGAGVMATGFGILSTAVIALKGYFVSLNVVIMANPFIALGVALAAITLYVVNLAQKMAPLVDKWTIFTNMVKSFGNPVKFAALMLESKAEAALAAAAAAEIAATEDEKLKNIQAGLEAGLKGVNTKLATGNTLLTTRAKLASAFGDQKETKSINKYTGKVDTQKGPEVVGFGIDPVTLMTNDMKASMPLLNEQLTLMAENITQRIAKQKEDFAGYSESTMMMVESVAGTFDQMGYTIARSLGMGETALGTFAGVLVQTAMTAIGTGLAGTMASGLEAGANTAKSFGPAAAFVLPALLAGAAVAVKSAFGKVDKPKRFAKGGIVSTPTMGLMGEYPGARSNPEVIAPLDKLKDMIGDRGGSSVQVGGEFVLKGQDLVVALERANNNRNRII